MLGKRVCIGYERAGIPPKEWAIETARKIGVISLGCPKNLVDSEVLLGLAREAGWEITADEAAAEVLLINTCCFIAPAEREARGEIERAAARKREGKLAWLIVAGCLPKRQGQRLAEEYPEIDALLGPGDLPKLPNLLRGLEEKTGTKRPAAAMSERTFLYDELTPRLLATPRHYAYSKIAEGCSRHCSFCIIPKLRGRQASRPIASIVAEAAALARGGARELNLIAQDLTAYGRDLAPAAELADLLERLAGAPTPPWIRLLYNYPDGFSERLIETIAAGSKILPYLDIPLQHIDRGVLRAMRREVEPQRVRELLAGLRERIPGLTLRTTLLVGFPGESERAFRELGDFVEEQRFEHLGVFPYSREEGTAAARRKDQVPEEERFRRAEEIMRLQSEIVLARQKASLGRPLQALVLGPSGRGDYPFFGRHQGQAPQIDGVTFLKSERPLAEGEIVGVRQVGHEEFDVLAEAEVPSTVSPAGGDRR